MSTRDGEPENKTTLTQAGWLNWWLRWKHSRPPKAALRFHCTHLPVILQVPLYPSSLSYPSALPHRMEQNEMQIPGTLVYPPRESTGVIFTNLVTLQMPLARSAPPPRRLFILGRDRLLKLPNSTFSFGFL